VKAGVRKATPFFKLLDPSGQAEMLRELSLLPRIQGNNGSIDGHPKRVRGGNARESHGTERERKEGQQTDNLIHRYQ